MYLAVGDDNQRLAFRHHSNEMKAVAVAVFKRKGESLVNIFSQNLATAFYMKFIL